MKRILILGLGLLGLALTPAMAQNASPAGKIHGHVTNPVGTAQGNGTVSLRIDSSGDKYTFPVNADGDYSGDAAPGTYTVLYRDPTTTKDKVVDQFDNIKIEAGQTIVQDFDLSRPDYIKKLSADQQKQLEDIKKKNSSAVAANTLIKQLNTDLGVVVQDIKDADAASETAKQELGAGATKQAIDAKVGEIKTAKFTDVETMMQKDATAAGTRTDVSIIFARLGQAKLGLKKYDEAEAAFKKALEMEAGSKKPNLEVQGLSQSGLGELYARTGKVDQATTAYDTAAQANPKGAAVYLKNQAVIYYQTGNTAAQVAAADKAIAADPTNPLLYYLKGQGLVGNATVDSKTNKIVLPPGCAEAYQKYLELAPTGPYAADAKSILDSAGQKIQSSYKAGKKS
ncbi:tetratricopeptide repeat protein [Terracidiphilus sp.]|jgi:tetratricopeptide (TPR) repeat protein|uniref:tetratricopeptide repeat protein n=1 Tax=Terracidiphilus sp. TaxID=1964191 RepID=UPI003C255C5D